MTWDYKLLCFLLEHYAMTNSIFIITLFNALIEDTLNNIVNTKTNSTNNIDKNILIPD